MGKSSLPLFQTRNAKGRILHRFYAASIFVGIFLIWTYRATHVPRSWEDGRLAWIGMFLAEIWFGFYWILTQSQRWNIVYREAFTERLSERYEQELPKVDVFVCTADHTIEPPIMVINTVLSVMSYDYPPEKLSVYLSDDGGSEFTFHALLEASHFCKHWLPFCKKYKVEPRSPAAYFESQSDANLGEDFVSVKKLYEEMESRIEHASKIGRIPDKSEHKGFASWDSSSSKKNHDTILQILINGSDPEAKDITGCSLPTLVYLAREKRPQHFHNFKAGAMNALIRVSSQISNAPVLLNVDCDMYSNDSQSIRHALCFLMDEEKGHELAFLQFPQLFKNVTKNDLYGNMLRVISKVEFHGLDGYGGPMYIGTGCFHRREVLGGGRKFSKETRINDLNTQNESKIITDVNDLEERLKSLAGCTFEENSEWGNEIGLKYGVPVEDVITGLSIHCKGWKSAYYNPERPGFLGVAATSLDQALVQHKRWSEGDLQILLSKYSPALFGLGKMNIGLIMGYCTYCLWSPNCFSALYYSIIPSLYLLKGIPLFPQVSSAWFLPFAYAILAVSMYSLVEFMFISGGTFLGWWNEQRMWLYKRTTSYLFAFMDTTLKLLGYSDMKFVISSKVSGEDVNRRYEEEVMEFGTASPMFTILASVALLNLFCFMGFLFKLWSDFETFSKKMALQILLSGVLIIINLPLYDALFVRKDNGRMPGSVTAKSVFFAMIACSYFSLV